VAAVRTTKGDLEQELKAIFGHGDYKLEIEDPDGGLTSPTYTRKLSKVSSGAQPLRVRDACG
jgi:hypothetical protein